jgi:predicted lipoprotein
MKNTLFASAVCLAIAFSSCHKASQTPTSTDTFTALEQSVITDFVNSTALPQYAGLVSAAVSLNTAVTNLNSTTTDANLQTAQTAWKAVRTSWEQCEGYLIGPVESYDYDPNTDTWPTDKTQLDSLLASSNPLQVSDVAALTQSLRGYHPLEYVLFGVGGSRTAASITAREKQYMVSLTADLLNNNVQPLYQSWASAPVNYAQAILAAGSGSTTYTTRLAFFLDITGDNGMAGICNEVGTEKMYDPFINKDSTITESPYSDNTLADFKNNIIGAQNVYLGLNGGKGVKDLVAAQNKSLDNKIQAQFTASISAFGNITERYEQAIFDQRVQVQQLMTQLSTLKDLLDGDLTDFLKQYIKD